jgi:hypothetical protein
MLAPFYFQFCYMMRLEKKNFIHFLCDLYFDNRIFPIL